MRYLINNKLYDTEKSEKIITFEKSLEIWSIGGVTMYKKFTHVLYKTNKGKYFLIIENCKNSAYDEIQLLTETEVKDLLCELNAIDTYELLFGEIEEG